MVAAADAAMVAVDAPHKVPEAMEVAAVDAVANTPPAHKVPVVLRATVVAVRAEAALPWVMHNPVATKADLAAAWASALPARRRAVNPIPCAPVSI